MAEGLLIALNSFSSDSDKSVLNSQLNLFVNNRTHFNFVKLTTTCIVELTFIYLKKTTSGEIWRFVPYLYT